MNFYVIKRPDGTLIEMPPQVEIDEAFQLASMVERRQPVMSGPELRASDCFCSRCWRAQGEKFSWKSHLAIEIGRLLGYAPVLVRVVRMAETESAASDIRLKSPACQKRERP